MEIPTNAFARHPHRPPPVGPESDTRAKAQAMHDARRAMACVVRLLGQAPDRPTARRPCTEEDVDNLLDVIDAELRRREKLFHDDVMARLAAI